MEISHKKSFVISIVAIAVVLVFIDVPLGPLPPISSIFNPSSGVWSEQSYPYIPGASFHNITQNGNVSEIMVYNEPDGFTGIYSNTTWGLYYEQGYLEAQYRLEQMDILKRTSEGNLSAILGSSELSTDIFFRDLNDYGIAQEEVANLSENSLTYIAVSEFVDGINAYINNLTPATLPILFKVLDFTPHDWTITDVFSIQQLFLWENSAGGFDPVYFNYALMNMPESVVQALYPAYPAGIQNPIVPYSLNPSVYSEEGDMDNLTLYSPSYNYTNDTAPVIPSVASGGSPIPSNYPGSFPLSDLQYNVYKDFGSNDWAVNGVKTSGVSSLLANDPHLTTTVPSIWMGFQLVSPGQNVVGVVFPGFPGVVLGHNPYVAWGATNGQIQETYFYAEQINPSNSQEFFFDGSWHHFDIKNETIQVKGSSPVKISVEMAPNGIVFMNRPDTIAMDWTGFYPTDELGFFLNIDRTASISQFVSNLSSSFKIGIQNWAVADSAGNIGIFPYGYYPVIARGNPRGILPGNGSYDWTGFVPVKDLPYLYDPSRGFVFSANQITVSGNYPYYIGWDYESGYRADEIYTLLNETSGFNTGKMENVQLTVHDFTTDIFLNPLIKTLEMYGMDNGNEYPSISSWDGNMTVNSTAATIYYYWLNFLVNDTFMPYMEEYGINSSNGLYQASFFLASDDTYHGPLIEDLVNWTMTDPDIKWFDNPVTGETRNESQVMALAYNQTIAYMTENYGKYSTSWEWGNIHKRYLSSFFGINYMNTGYLPAAGDGNTINAAYGTLSDFGPSWRMVVNLSHPDTAVGIYPGGISENPISSYYENDFVPWNDGTYYRLIPLNAPGVFYNMYGGS